MSLAMSTLSDIYIGLRNDDAGDDGTRDNPYDGSTDTLFDKIMGLVPAGTTVRLGPGTFQTRGFGAAVPGGTLKNGQRLVGCGMYATTLQLVKGAPLPGQSAAIAIIVGSNVADVEISDLT